MREITVEHKGRSYTVYELPAGSRFSWGVSEDGDVMAALDKKDHSEWDRYPGLREKLVKHMAARLMVIVE